MVIFGEIRGNLIQQRWFFPGIGKLFGLAVLIVGALLAWDTDALAGATERVSVDSNGDQGNSRSPRSAISADGRFVAFMSRSILVSGDTIIEDIYVHDRQTGVTERVSVDSNGIAANLRSDFLAISADGQFVAFGSFASNLVFGDTNDTFDIFVHDRQTGTTERVSVDSSGVEADKNTRNFFSTPSISADGRFVAFGSVASNLVPGDTNGVDPVNGSDAFVHDRQTGTTERVSVNSNGDEGNPLDTPTGAPSALFPAISADGRFVSFGSNSSNLVPGDTNDRRDIFVHDRQTHTTERVSVLSNGDQGSKDSFISAISADGRFVAFGSRTNHLEPNITGLGSSSRQMYVHDRQTKVTELVSKSSEGVLGNNNSSSPSISADGRFIAFSSDANNLVPGDTNFNNPDDPTDGSDIFVHDRQTGTTQRVSVDSNGEQGNEKSLNPAISADGRFVAFSSHADNLVPGDTNTSIDVFVHDRAVVTSTDVPHNIVDFGTVSSTLTGPNLLITDINLIFNRLDHTCVRDLHIELTSPNGTNSLIIESANGGGILTGLGCPDNLLNTVLDDDAATNFRDGAAPWTGAFNVEHASVAAMPLSTFDGENALGTWTLTIRDNSTLDHGQLISWSIEFETNLTRRFGVTVITHGFLPGTSENLPGWAIEMGVAILKHRAKKGRLWEFNAETDELKDITLDQCGTEYHQLTCPFNTASDGEQVILVNWRKKSNNSTPGFAEATGHALYSLLMGGAPGHPTGFVGPPNNRKPLHFIGHSLGAVVNSEAIQRLGALENITVEQMTTLDPHDWDQQGSLIEIDGRARVPDVRVWTNVEKADNYYQANDPFGPSPMGRAIPGSQISGRRAIQLPACADAQDDPPDGTPCLGFDLTEYECFRNPRLSHCDLFNTSRVSSAPHSRVHTFYHGTIDPGVMGNLQIPDDNIVVDELRALDSWYNGNEDFSTGDERSRGYAYSRLGEKMSQDHFDKDCRIDPNAPDPDKPECDDVERPNLSSTAEDDVHVDLIPRRFFDGVFSSAIGERDARPGWKDRGVDEKELSAGNVVAELDSFGSSMIETHLNYVPPDASHLEFDLAASVNTFGADGADDSLHIFFVDENGPNELEPEIIIGSGTDEFIKFTRDLTPFRGQSGTFQFELRGNPGIGSAVRLDNISINEPGVRLDDFPDGPDTSVQLELDTPISGVNETAFEADWFRVSLQGSVDYLIEAFVSGTGYDPLLRLIDEDGSTVLAEDFMQSTISISFTPESDLNGFVAILSAEAGGSYTISLNAKTPGTSVTDFFVPARPPTTTTAWIDTGLTVSRGDTLQMTASGEVGYDFSSNTSDPDGVGGGGSY